ncbi:MAG: ATP-binding protein [Candidatus Nanopelagicales bacterium]|nr:ATP-binding protein [Candidatus Nanopelagicales bacterium]
MSAFNESGSSDLAIYFGDFLSTIAAFTMPAMADSVLVARQQVTDLLSHENAIDLDHAIAVTSELVANSVVHAATELQVVFERWQYMVKVVVEDANHQIPVMRSLDVAVDSGRGMHIVDEFADLWGYELTENGKRIWAGFNIA